jgi:fatty acid/phospholipid biosynthesis enzyme
MGGDHAPAVVVEGALAAARHLDVRVLLVGPEARVTSAIRPLAGGYAGALDVIDAGASVDEHG